MRTVTVRTLLVLPRISSGRVVRFFFCRRSNLLLNINWVWVFDDIVMALCNRQPITRCLSVRLFYRDHVSIISASEWNSYAGPIIFTSHLVYRDDMHLHEFILEYAYVWFSYGKKVSMLVLGIRYTR